MIVCRGTDRRIDNFTFGLGYSCTPPAVAEVYLQDVFAHEPRLLIATCWIWQVPETLFLDNPDLVGAAYFEALQPHGLKYIKLDFLYFLGRLKKLLYEAHSLTGDHCNLVESGARFNIQRCKVHPANTVSA